MSARSLVLALLVALPLAGATAAWAQSSASVAERDDAHILKVVTTMQGYTETLPGGDDAPAWILYRQFRVDSQEKTSKAFLNMIVEVREKDGVPAHLLEPYAPWADEGIESASAFVIRGGAILERPAGTAEEVPEEIGMPRVSFAWPELQKGDVIGWSIAAEKEGPYLAIRVPMADTVPMVISSVHAEGHGQFAYKVRWYGMEASEISFKEQDPKDGRPMVFKLSSNQRAAVADTPLVPPFPDSYPHLMLVLDEVWLQSEQPMVRSGWIPMGGLNQAAAGLAAQLDRSTEQTKGLDITLSAITTGKKTVADKALAIAGYVHDKFALLAAPEYQRSGTRELGDVFKAKEGTELELALLTAVMMRQADVPVVLAVFREPDKGPWDDDFPHFSQFTQTALRVEAEGEVLWFAPQCTTCAPGTLPAEWAGAKVLVWPADLSTTAKADSEKMQREAMAAGTIDPAQFTAKIEELPWTTWETIPAH